MMIFGWCLSVFATSLALAMLWLYGDGHRKAPVFGLAVCLCWAVYDVLFEQWPLLLPTMLNVVVQVRNLRRMRKG